VNEGVIHDDDCDFHGQASMRQVRLKIASKLRAVIAAACRGNLEMTDKKCDDDGSTPLLRGSASHFAAERPAGSDPAPSH